MKRSLVLKGIMALGVMLIAAFAFLFTNANISPEGVEQGAEVVTTASMGFGALNTSITERGAAYFEWLIGKNTPDQYGHRERTDFDSQFVSDYKSGKKILEGFVYYQKARITTDGRVQVIQTANNPKVEGITNLDNGKIEAGSVAVITDISLGYGTSVLADNKAVDTVLTNSFIFDNTTQAKAGLVDMDSGASGNQFAAVAVQRVPTKLLNSEYLIMAGNDPIQEGRIKNLFVPNLNGAAIAGEYAVPLRAPRVITDKAAISFDIKFAKTADAMANDVHHVVDLELIGIRVRNRS